MLGKIRWRRAASVALIATSIWATAPSVATSVNETSDPGTLPALSFGDDATPWKDIVVDGDDVERDADGNAYNVFGGFGSVSCNNTSRLLLDYREENPAAYWRILNLLFNRRTGAGLNHIKVELGSDTDTSSGAEPATKRSADEPANVLRGAGFRLIADAKKINPHVKVEALRWGEPSWTGNRPADRYRWYKETIDAAYDTYGVKFDYISPSQNEVSMNHLASELGWVVDFAQRLEADARADDARYDYSKIKVVAMDSYRNGETVSAAILNSAAALGQIDAIGIHYTIGGGPNLTRLNKEYGKEILYSEGVAPMIDPEYRINAQPERGGIGGTVGAVDIADRFINAYRWSGSGNHPAHMTSFLFQPAVSALYEGSSYSPKHLIRASDPWSGYYEGGVGITLVRHFMQFIDQGWEYIEGASYGDGTFADGGTAVDSSTRTYLTLREPAKPADANTDRRGTDFTQVHANNTSKARYFEVKVTDLGTTSKTPLYLWQTKGPDDAARQPVDVNHFKNIGYVTPVRSETGDNGSRYFVYRIKVEPYSILTMSSQARGIHRSAKDYTTGEYAPNAENSPLALPYSDDFEYAGYPTENVNGVDMTYLERRGGTPRYTADQNGAFEVVESGDGNHDNVLQQRIHADNRGYTWNVWGDGSQNRLSTATPATILGDHTWANYRASIDVRFDRTVRNPALPNFAGLGVRQVVTQGSDLAAYALRLSPAGAWQLRKLDTVVASGTITGFDPDAWHRISLEAKENQITPAVDGSVLTTWTDSAPNPVMAGRIALTSGYYQNSWDNLSVEPVEGHAWRSDKLDDTASGLTYTGATQFQQVGFANYNRTLHVLSPGASVTVPFQGAELNIFGATARATLDVAVDGAPAQRITVGATGTRQTSYWLRGLTTTDPHRLTVTVVTGTFTVDGIDILGGPE
ncbi:glycoside hydrolase family 30 protein [Kribbella swartbergensis]